jgi:hypothetical protein
MLRIAMLNCIARGFSRIDTDRILRSDPRRTAIILGKRIAQQKGDAREASPNS